MASGPWVGLSPAVRGDVVHAASKSIHDEAGASRDLVLHGKASAHPSEAMMTIQPLQQTAASSVASRLEVAPGRGRSTGCSAGRRSLQWT
jgi:hypothetical protein